MNAMGVLDPVGMVRHQRLKVLFVGAFPPPDRAILGGNVTDCQTLLNSSFAKRVELALLDSSQGVPTPPLIVRVTKALRRIVCFLVLFERFRPDVTLVFASGGLSFIEKSLLAAYSRARGSPAVMSIRSGHFIDQVRGSSLFRWLAGHLLRVPYYLLCQGRRWQEFYRNEFGIPESRCPVVESWVVTEELLRLGSERRVRRGEVEVLFIGHLEEFKGVFDLLESIAILSRDPTLPPIRLRMCGDGSARKKICSWLERHRLSDRVILEGWVRGDAKLDAFKRADIFVLPSHTEGLPNAMLEAMAAGLPVVVTPVGSIPDVVESGRNGILVEARRPTALAASIRHLALSPELRERLGKSAFEVARHRFDVERAADQLVNLLTFASMSGGTHRVRGKQAVSSRAPDSLG